MENSKDCENGAVYQPLLDRERNHGVTPFATAGFLSKMSFWWLNPLMKLGKEKILQDDDIPRLRLEERAETCYSRFMEQQHKAKKKNPVLTLSTGPLFLSAIIMVAEGEEAFEDEGYVLAGGLFLAKCLESLAERQRIPTVVDCTMVLAISDGRLAEHDEPMKLVGKEDSLFGQLYKEYWSRTSNASNCSENL